MIAKGRTLWIDVAKGFCMILVIAGHLDVKEIENVVYTFHMTVFFILSGYTMKSNLSIESLNHRFRSLMVPYFITCAAVTVVDVLNYRLLYNLGDFLSVSKVLAKNLIRSFMASGTIKTFGSIQIESRIGAIWFLPALFFATWFVQALLKYLPNLQQRYSVAMTMALISCISSEFIWFPFSVQSALMAAPLVMLGYDWRQQGFLDKLSPKTVLICTIVFVAGLLLGKTPIYFVTCRMNDYILSIIGTLAASICVIYLSQKLEFCRPLAWIGKNSIYFLCIHLFELNTLGKWFQRLIEGVGLPYNAGTKFVVKIIFITLVTALLLLIKNLPRNSGLKATESQTDRDYAIDASKALLITLMILGSFTMDSKLRAIIYSFHMMAFVFYSGYCFRPEVVRDMPRAVFREVKRLLIPYAMFAVVYVLLVQDGNYVEVKRILFGISFSRKLFPDIASIGPVYFILMLFLTKVLYLFVERIVPDERSKALCVLALSVWGMYLGNNKYWLPWSADCALYALIYFYLGHCFKKYGILDCLIKRSYSYFALSSMWAFMIYKGSMELAVRNYGLYGIAVLGAVSASVLLYMLCDYLCKNWNRHLMDFVCFVGRNAMCVLIIHSLLHASIEDFVSLKFAEGGFIHTGITIIVQVLVGVGLGLLREEFQRQFQKKTQQIVV